METITFGFSVDQYRDEAVREAALEDAREGVGTPDEEQVVFMSNGEEVEDITEADTVLVVMIYRD